MKFYFYGRFNVNGKSEFVESNTDDLTNIKTKINELLPERAKFHHLHPELLQDNSLDFTDNNEISVRFMGEGAGYRNSLAYFIYDTKNPPKSLSHIDKCYFIFPNFSAKGSGGDMEVGDKIKLGSEFETYEIANNLYVNPTNFTFSEGKSVGFLLFPDAWSGDGVKLYINPYTTISSLNPERAQELKYHTVCLKIGGVNDRLVLGMEDINRESSSCDHDFNDAIMLIETSLANIGKGFSDKDEYKNFDVEPDQPESCTIGYKKIFSNIQGTVVECVATLMIPSDATIYHKKLTNRLKTNRAYVKTIHVVPSKSRHSKNVNNISKKLTSGYSWFNNNFMYNTTKFSEITEEMTETNLVGIYFYRTFQEAANYDFLPTTL